MLKEININNFESEVLKSEQPVVVDVWAPWCGPCKMMEPHFKEAAEQYAGKARFVKLNADKNQEIARRYKVMGIPTLLFFSHGFLVDRKTGVQKAGAISKRVETLLSYSADDAEKNEFTGIFRWPFRRKKSRK